MLEKIKPIPCAPTLEEIFGENSELYELHYKVTHKNIGPEDFQRIVKETGFSRDELNIISDLHTKLRQYGFIPVGLSSDGEKILWRRVCPINYGD